MTEENCFILNKKDTEIINYTEILKDVKKNKYYGDILWPSNSNEAIKCQIENKLKNNNINFSRFPSDYIHLLLCEHVTKEKFEKGDEFTFNKEKWIVHKIHDVSTGLIGEANRSINTVQILFAVLYIKFELSNFGSNFRKLGF